MNRAHGGKRPRFYDIVIKLKGAELIYYTIHNEEGARFWKKSNWNVIVKLKNPYDKRTTRYYEKNESANSKRPRHI